MEDDARDKHARIQIASHVWMCDDLQTPGLSLFDAFKCRHTLPKIKSNWLCHNSPHNKVKLMMRLGRLWYRFAMDQSHNKFILTLEKVLLGYLSKSSVAKMSFEDPQGFFLSSSCILTKKFEKKIDDSQCHWVL